MANTTNVSGGGIGFAGLLTLIFITLKLVGVVGWSWWWVLAPAWISAGLVIIVLGFVLAIMGIVLLVGQKKKK